jgi:hypothetical protein
VGVASPDVDAGELGLGEIAHRAGERKPDHGLSAVVLHVRDLPTARAPTAMAYRSRAGLSGCVLALSQPDAGRVETLTASSAAEVPD